MKKFTINEEVNRMRKIMGLNEGLGASIDEQMMSPKAVALRLVEMLPDDYNEDDVERALDEYINTGAINIYVSEKFRRDDKWRNELFANIKELKGNGLGEAEEVDLSKVDNPNAYTDDIFNHNAERAEDPFDDGDSTRVSMIVMSMLSDIQEEAPEVADKINMVKRLIGRMNDKTEIPHSQLDAIMQGLDEGELFEGSRSSQYDDSHGSPYDRGWADKYYGRPMDPHKYPEGTYKGEKITDLTPEELEAYQAGYENCDDQKDWG